VPAFIERVVIDKFVIGPLSPTPRRFIVLARKDTHGSRDGDVGGVVKANLIFPVETSRRNPRVRQPIERDVVEHVISCKRACGVSIYRAPEHGRGDCRRRLGPTVNVIEVDCDLFVTLIVVAQARKPVHRAVVGWDRPPLPNTGSLLAINTGHHAPKGVGRCYASRTKHELIELPPHDAMATRRHDIAKLDFGSCI
jgi:hypothetical protein